MTRCSISIPLHMGYNDRDSAVVCIATIRQVSKRGIPVLPAKWL